MKYLQPCIAPNFDGIGTLEHDSIEMARPDGSGLAFKFRRYCNGRLVIVNPNVLQETWLIRGGAGNGVFVRRSGFAGQFHPSQESVCVQHEQRQQSRSLQRKSKIHEDISSSLPCEQLMQAIEAYLESADRKSVV